MFSFTDIGGPPLVGLFEPSKCSIFMLGELEISILLPVGLFLL